MAPITQGAGRFEIVANDVRNHPHNLHIDGKIGGSIRWATSTGPSLNCMLELAFGDKVHSTLRVSGGAKTVTITGQADLDLSWFSGKYLP